MAQAGALAAGKPVAAVGEGLAAAASAGWLSEGEATELTEIWTLFWVVNLTAKLLTDQPLDPETLGQGGCEMLMRDTGAEGAAALQDRIETLRDRAGTILDGALDEEEPSDE